MQLLQKEAALVAYCVRTDRDPSTQDEVARILSFGVNWPRVLSMVRSNGVLPPFRENILQYCPEKIPSSVRDQMQAEFQSDAAESLNYARELTRVSACLEQNGIRAIAFKGPTLAQQLYGKFALRQCRDLDILIEKNQFEQAIRALRSAGYIPVWPEYPANQDIFQIDKHILLIAETGGSKVEIHWSLAVPDHAFPLRFSELWSRKEHLSVLGSLIHIPSKEDLLLILCFHAAAHYWGSLKWICDIAELLKHNPDLDWLAMLTRARKLGCCRILLISVTLARDIAGTRLPEPLDREARRDPIVEEFRTFVLSRFSTEASPLRCVERPLTHIRTRERLRDRLWLIAEFVRKRLKPNANDHAWVRLPTGLAFLYIFIRIARVACKRYNVTIIPLLKSILCS